MHRSIFYTEDRHTSTLVDYVIETSFPHYRQHILYLAHLHQDFLLSADMYSVSEHLENHTIFIILIIVTILTKTRNAFKSIIYTCLWVQPKVALSVNFCQLWLGSKHLLVHLRTQVCLHMWGCGLMLKTNWNCPVTLWTIGTLFIGTVFQNSPGLQLDYHSTINKHWWKKSLCTYHILK